MPPLGYSAAVARRVVGVSQRCLDYWAERRIVAPSIQPADGKGSERKYAFDDLVKLALVKKMRVAGLSLQKIQKGLEHLRKRWPKNDPLLDEMLATDGASFFRIRGDQVEDVLASGQLILSVVAVGRIRQDVRANVVEISSLQVPSRGRPAATGGKRRVAEGGA